MNTENKDEKNKADANIDVIEDQRALSTQTLTQQLEELTGLESRTTILGHVQRGGTPSAFDRVLATRFGVAAANAAIDGESGVMVALRSTNIVTIPLAEAVATIRGVPPDVMETARAFFG